MLMSCQQSETLDDHLKDMITQVEGLISAYHKTFAHDPNYVLSIYYDYNIGCIRYTESSVDIDLGNCVPLIVCNNRNVTRRAFWMASLVTGVNVYIYGTPF